MRRGAQHEKQRSPGGSTKRCYNISQDFSAGMRSYNLRWGYERACHEDLGGFFCLLNDPFVQEGYGMGSRGLLELE